jgi:hypothetical protein
MAHGKLNLNGVWEVSQGIGIGILLVSFLFVIIFSLFIASSAILYLSEIIPNCEDCVIRQLGIGVAITTGWVFNFILAMASPMMFSNIRYFTFLVFTIICICLFLLLSAFTETKGLNEEEIQRIFEDDRNDELEAGQRAMSVQKPENKMIVRLNIV